MSAWVWPISGRRSEAVAALKNQGGAVAMTKCLVIVLLTGLVLSLFPMVAWGMPGTGSDPVNGTTDEEGLSNSTIPPPYEHKGYGYDAVRERMYDRFRGRDNVIRDPWDVVVFAPAYATAYAVWKLMETCIGFPMPVTWSP